MLPFSSRLISLPGMLSSVARPLFGGRIVRRRKNWQSCGVQSLGIETLEARQLLAADLSAILDDGYLTISDVDATGKDNSLSVSVIGTDLVISDDNEQFIAAPAGCTLSNGDKTLTIPLSLIDTHDARAPGVTINAGGGADTIVVNSLGSEFKPYLMIYGDDGDDSVTFQGAPSISTQVINVKAETITVNSALTVAQMQLIATGDDTMLSINAPLTIGGYSDFVADKMAINASVSIAVGWLRLSPDNAADQFDRVDIGAVGDGTADTLELSDAELDRISAEIIMIGDVVTGTITVSGAIEHAGDDDIILSSFKNVVFSSGASWTTHDGYLSVNGASMIGGNITGPGVEVDGARLTSTGSGHIALYGVGGNVGEHNVGVYVHGGTVIESTGTGAIYVTGLGGRGTSETHGVEISGLGTELTSVTGQINIVGTGGLATGDQNLGVWLHSGASIISTGAAPISIDGSGGSGVNDNTGVMLNGDGTSGPTNITTRDGNISIFGHGSESVTGYSVTGSGNRGIGMYAGSLIQSTGSGTISLGGRGRTGSGDSRGVELFDDGTLITSANGDIQIVGRGGDDSSAYGVWISGAAVESTGNGQITVQGAAGTGPASVGIWIEDGLAGPSITTSAGTGNITLMTNSVHLDDAVHPGSIDGGAQSVTILPLSNGTPIYLGEGGSGDGLELLNAELDRITAGTLIIGNSSSGDIFLNDNLTPANATNLQLVTGSDLLFNGGSVDTAGGSLRLESGGIPHGITLASSGVEASASITTLSGVLSITLNGTVVDTDYSQLNLLGDIDLNGAELQLSGSYIPPKGTTFVIVDAAAGAQLTGTFHDLSEGAFIDFNGRVLQISYQGGPDGNDVVLTSVNLLPVAADFDLLTTEDVPIVNILPATDRNLDPLTFSIVSNPSHGTVLIVDASTGAYTYIPDPGYSGSDSFTFLANDGEVDGNTATATVLVNGVPDLELNGESVTYNAKSARRTGPIHNVPNVTVNDPDLAPSLGIGGGTLVVTIDVAAKITKKRVNLIDKIGGLAAASSIGTSTGPSFADGKLVLHVVLNDDTTVSDVQNFLRGITFKTHGQGLKRLHRIFQAQVTDAAGATSNTLQQTITVTKK